MHWDSLLGSKQEGHFVVIKDFERRIKYTNAITYIVSQSAR